MSYDVFFGTDAKETESSVRVRGAEGRWSCCYAFEVTKGERDGAWHGKGVRFSGVCIRDRGITHGASAERCTEWAGTG